VLTAAVCSVRAQLAGYLGIIIVGKCSKYCLEFGRSKYVGRAYCFWQTFVSMSIPGGGGSCLCSSVVNRTAGAPADASSLRHWSPNFRKKINLRKVLKMTVLRPPKRRKPLNQCRSFTQTSQSVPQLYKTSQSVPQLHTNLSISATALQNLSISAAASQPTVPL
jgi:hypothetical protein